MVLFPHELGGAWMGILRLEHRLLAAVLPGPVCPVGIVPREPVAMDRGGPGGTVALPHDPPGDRATGPQRLHGNGPRPDGAAGFRTIVLVGPPLSASRTRRSGEARVVRRSGVVLHHADLPDPVRETMADHRVGVGGRRALLAVPSCSPSGPARRRRRVAGRFVRPVGAQSRGAQLSRPR